MVDCHIDGVYGNYIEICVKPGKEWLLEIKKDEGASSFSAKISKLYYNID